MGFFVIISRPHAKTYAVCYYHSTTYKKYASHTVFQHIYIILININFTKYIFIIYYMFYYKRV